MMHTLVRALAVVALLALPAMALAHEGHAHKVMGTVTARSADQFEMKTPEGKVVIRRSTRRNPRDLRVQHWSQHHFAFGLRRIEPGGARNG